MGNPVSFSGISERSYGRSFVEQKKLFATDQKPRGLRAEARQNSQFAVPGLCNGLLRRNYQMAGASGTDHSRRSNAFAAPISLLILLKEGLENKVIASAENRCRWRPRTED
jgi:hypothetical protein